MLTVSNQPFWFFPPFCNHHTTHRSSFFQPIAILSPSSVYKCIQPLELIHHQSGIRYKLFPRVSFIHRFRLANLVTLDDELPPSIAVNVVKGLRLDRHLLNYKRVLRQIIKQHETHKRVLRERREGEKEFWDHPLFKKKKGQPLSPLAGNVWLFASHHQSWKTTKNDDDSRAAAASTVCYPDTSRAQGSNAGDWPNETFI